MSLKSMAQEKIERAGITNYVFDHDMLVMCGTRYTIEACTCGEPECDGVVLNRAKAMPSTISSSSTMSAERAVQ